MVREVVRKNKQIQDEHNATCKALQVPILPSFAGHTASVNTMHHEPLPGTSDATLARCHCCVRFGQPDMSLLLHDTTANALGTQLPGSRH